MQGVKKKAALTDRTNFTVPTSTVLHKLKLSLNIPISKPSSNSSSLPNNLDPGFSESETSIGSSNYNHIVDKNPTLRSTPHHGNRSGNQFEPVNGRKNAPEKTKDKEEKTSLQLITYSQEKTKVKGKSSAALAGKTKDTGSDNQFEPVNGRKKAPEKTKDKEEKTTLQLITYSQEKAKVKGKSSAALTGKTKDTGKIKLMPIGCRSVVNTRSKTKENVEPFSFSTLPRTGKRRDVSNEGGTMCVSHSYSAPQPNHTKKKSRLLVGGNDLTHDLPREYVEQQLAYFKEIDAFELEEEEVSENESDNEDTSMETPTI